MSIIYLKVTMRKTEVLKNFDFVSLNNLSRPRLVFRELQLPQISLNFETSCWNLKIRGLEEKHCVAFLLF